MDRYFRLGNEKKCALDKQKVETLFFKIYPEAFSGI